MLSEIRLDGSCYAEMDTEIKYSVVSAKYDKYELMLIKILNSDDEKDNDRRVFCATKVLRALKKNGDIQFFLSAEAIDLGSTEASYLKNKYPDEINKREEGYSLIFVKL